MPPEKGDSAYLLDMLDAARAVRDMNHGIEFDTYMRNRTLQLATERGIEIVGEAARFVSEGFRSAHPEIAWTKIVGQRHVLAHNYGAIQHERLWRAEKTHIPALIAQLEPLIPGDHGTPADPHPPGCRDEPAL